MENGQFGAKETCASVSLCKAEAGACTEMMCMPNAKTCTSDGTLRTCNADGSAFAGGDVSCGAGMCDQIQGRCNKCAPSSKRCESTSVVSCSADGQTISTMACTPKGECWTASCSGSSCQDTAKTASDTARCNGNGYCDGRGSCFACLADRHCSSTQTCDTATHTCKEKPCGNGVFDPGENCDPKHPYFVNRKDLCDSNCRITDAVYMNNCTRQGECWTGAPWACASTQQCTTACDSSTRDFCKTNTGKGDCLTITDTMTAKPLQGCLINCASPFDCPNGLVCTNLPGDSQKFCAGVAVQ
jgi:hypothetical protein